ncbi:MAG: MFS transporter [Spirochaetales bacterium]|nr:MFS transporter [Spirochaetales bacterium]
MSKPPINQRITYLLILGIYAKLLVDTTIQLFNPFLTIIAAGAGISAVTLGGIVAIRGLMGLTAPIIGTVADKIGYRKIMQLSLFISGLGMILAGISQNIILFSIAIILTGIGHAGYTPNLHAYLSSKLPYEKRARGIGIIEYAWAFAGIAGLFAAGYLIEEFSWRSPFILFGSLLILASIVYFTLPVSHLDNIEKLSENNNLKTNLSLKKRLISFFDLGPNARSAWGTIIVQGLNIFAIMHVMIIHGGWLESEYGLSPSRLGSIALVFGITDLIASVFVSVAVDKIGKKKSVAIGVAGMTIGYALMPFLNIGMYFAILSILIPRIFFEFATVSNLALLTEQVPEQRGKIMSLSTSFGLVGITLSSALGPVTYYSIGVKGLALVSFAAGLISFILIMVLVKDRSHSISK